MYAIVKSGGKQYRVEDGASLVVERLSGFGVGQEVVLGKVLLLVSDKEVKIGRPVVEGASVVTRVVAQKKSPKVLVFKKKPKKGYKKLQGHRQYVTELKIVKINF
jgi:large subunit ribosomal protein L21